MRYQHRKYFGCFYQQRAGKPRSYYRKYDRLPGFYQCLFSTGGNGRYQLYLDFAFRLERYFYF